MLNIKKLGLFIITTLLLTSSISYAENTENTENIFEASSSGNLERVKYLVEQGVGINSINYPDDSEYEESYPEESTALMQASEHGHIDVVKYLVENKAGINLKNRKGLTALKFASDEENIDVVKYLKSKGAK